MWFHWWLFLQQEIGNLGLGKVRVGGSGLKMEMSYSLGFLQCLLSLKGGMKFLSHNSSEINKMGEG